MNKNKLKFILYVLVFCIVLTAGSFFYLGTFFADDITYIKVDNKDTINNTNSDVKMILINEELKKLVDFVSRNDFIFKPGENLDVIAPKMFETVYGGIYLNEISNNINYKVMTSETYDKFRDYFNVTLENINIMGNKKIAYKQNNVENSKYFLDLDYPKLKGNIYEVNVKLVKNNEVVNEGVIKVSIVNDHIYYFSFYINEF